MRWNTGLAFICSLNGSVTVWGEACVFIPGTTELTLSWKRAFCLRENLEGRLSVFGVAVHKTGSVVIYPANSRADLAPQSRSRVLSAPAAGPDLSEVVYPGNLMTFSQDAPLINSNTCSRHNLVVYGKPQMPATGKCISKIQCSTALRLQKDGVRARMPHGFNALYWERQTHTRHRDTQNALSAAWNGELGRRNGRASTLGFPLKEMKMFWKRAMVIRHFSVNNINHYGLEPFEWADCVLCTSCLKEDSSFGLSLYALWKWTLSS